MWKCLKLLVTASERTLCCLNLLNMTIFSCLYRIYSREIRLDVDKGCRVFFFFFFFWQVKTNRYCLCTSFKINLLRNVETGIGCIKSHCNSKFKSSINALPCRNPISDSARQWQLKAKSTEQPKLSSYLSAQCTLQNSAQKGNL